MSKELSPNDDVCRKRIGEGITVIGVPKGKVEDALFNKYWANDYEGGQKKFNYGVRLYQAIQEGKANDVNIGSVNVKGISANGTLTRKEKRDIEVFVHNLVYGTNYKVDDLANAKGIIKDALSQILPKSNKLEDKLIPKKAPKNKDNEPKLTK